MSVAVDLLPLYEEKETLPFQRETTRKRMSRTTGVSDEPR